MRYAGVPVALINPVKAPKDATLYAATLYFDSDGSGIGKNIHESYLSKNSESLNNKSNKSKFERFVFAKHRSSNNRQYTA